MFVAPTIGEYHINDRRVAMKIGIACTVLFLLGTILLISSSSGERSDTLTIQNWDPAWEKKGVWIYIDSTLDDKNFNGYWVHSYEPTTEIGACPSKTDIIVWSPSYRMHRDTLTFTKNVDKKVLRIRKLYDRIPIVFWAIEDDTLNLSYLVEQHLDSINAVLKAEHTGIQLCCSRINLRSTRAHSPYAIKGMSTPGNIIKDLEKDNIIEDGVLNVYISPREGKETHGWSIPQYNVLLVPYQSSWGLLLHEICHSLGLDHTYQSKFEDPRHMPDADSTNIMMHSSSYRRYFTDGQILTMHYTRGSWLNKQKYPDTGIWPLNTDSGRIPKLTLCLWDSLSYNFPTATTGATATINTETIEDCGIISGTILDTIEKTIN